MMYFRWLCSIVKSKILEHFHPAVLIDELNYLVFVLVKKINTNWKKLSQVSLAICLLFCDGRYDSNVSCPTIKSSVVVPVSVNYILKCYFFSVRTYYFSRKFC